MIFPEARTVLICNQCQSRRTFSMKLAAGTVAKCQKCGHPEIVPADPPPPTAVVPQSTTAVSAARAQWMPSPKGILESLAAFIILGIAAWLAGHAIIQGMIRDAVQKAIDERQEKPSD